MKKQILFAGASLLAIAALSATASAADLPSRMQAPMLSAPPVFTWTGFYIGSTVGGMSVDTKTTGVYGYAEEDPSVYNMRSTDSTVTVGSTIGYNYQIANFVLGLEADYNWAHLEGDHTLDYGDDNVHTKMNGFGTVRGRLGLAWDRALLYITGGYAFANLTSSYNFDGDGFVSTKTNSGWVIGTGVEYAIAPHVSIKLEGLYMDFGKKSGTDQGYCRAGFKTTATVGRVGLNYKF